MDIGRDAAAPMRKPRQARLFDPDKVSDKQIAIARIILDKGETRYTGEGSLMTRWATAVLERAK